MVEKTVYKKGLASVIYDGGYNAHVLEHPDRKKVMTIHT
jgi:hypothetical protein